MNPVENVSFLPKSASVILPSGVSRVSLMRLPVETEENVLVRILAVYETSE
jgi:hypothetical protein